MPPRPPLHTQGFSLLELLFVCLTVAILASVAIPSFREYSLNARRTERVNSLVHALHAARSAAIRRGKPVVLCKSRDGLQCTPAARGWEEGWIVFANEDGDAPPVVDAGEQVLLRAGPVSGLTISANRDALTYWPTTRAGTTATFVFCDQRGPVAARAVIVSQTGRPRVASRDGSGALLECP